ncbi:MAG: proteasome-type protease [Gammaproteobacteria bacterium]|nr:proteasome-type protease [Gammaproteobacteria bacterium]
MTYCLAIKVDRGLVFASDSRTSAGVDYVTTYSKMHTFIWPGDRVIILLTAGNLATTQAVINNIQRHLEDTAAEFDLRRARHMFEIAHYVGTLNQAEQRQHAEVAKGSNISIEASFIVGGQIAGQPPELFLIYPQGNYISASPETPFLQIGENKYGKPILDRVIEADTTLEDAARCALVSLDSTMRSNLSVGPPLEVAIHERDGLDQPRRLKLTLASPLYRDLQARWNEGLHNAFRDLPRFEWE